MSDQPVTVFFSYSHKDEELRDELATHLRILENQGIIRGWHDRKILPGQEWNKEINENLETSDIVLLLISADFLASNYCWEVEVRRALERHKNKESIVIPIILSPCLWHAAPFGKLQALPKDGVPVLDKSWHTLHDAFYDIAQGIQKAVEEITNSIVKPPPIIINSGYTQERILFIKNVKDPNDWAYPINRMENPESREFDLMWRHSAHGAEIPKKGDLMILHQRAKVTHVVQFLDNETIKKETGYFRKVKAIWMPEKENWNELPHQREILGFSPKYADGNTHSFLSQNFSTFTSRWDSLEEFQNHISAILFSSTDN